MTELSRARRTFEQIAALPTIHLRPSGGVDWTIARFGLGPFPATLRLDEQAGTAHAIVELGAMNEPGVVEEAMNQVPYPAPVATIPLQTPGAPITLEYRSKLSQITSDEAIGLLAACALYTVALVDLVFDSMAVHMRKRLLTAGYRPGAGFGADPRTLLAMEPAPSASDQSGGPVDVRNREGISTGAGEEGNPSLDRFLADVVAEGDVPVLQEFLGEEWEPRVNAVQRLLEIFETTVCLDVTRSDGVGVYVQAAREDDGLLVEAVSNEYLTTAGILDAGAVNRLIELGWAPPAHDDHPNFLRRFDAPVETRQVAWLIAQTLHSVYGVQPGDTWAVSPVHLAERIAASDPVAIAPAEKSETFDSPISRPSDIVPIIPGIGRLIEQVHSHAAGQLAVDVRNEELCLLAVQTGRVIGRAHDDTLVLVLEAAEAKREAARLGELAFVVPAQEPNSLELWLSSGLLDMPDSAARVRVLAIRALHAATTETADVHPLDISDLVEATLEKFEFEQGPEDLRDYWDRRLEVMLQLFDVDVNQPEHWATWVVIEHLAVNLAGESSPFAGIFEWPTEVGKAMSSYGEHFGELDEERRALGERAMRDLFCLLDPTLDTRTVEITELIGKGVEARPPRDRLDLMMDGDF